MTGPDDHGGVLDRRGRRFELGVRFAPGTARIANLSLTTIAGRSVRVAHNHFSRRDPRHRRSGNQLHLVMRLYVDVFARVDCSSSYVDPQNEAGVRLGFSRPWPSGVSRVLFSCDRLRAAPVDVALLTPDLGRAAALCTTTHGGNALWTGATEASVRLAGMRAPSVLGESRWLTNANAACARWVSGERRRYASAERSDVTIAAYGFAGESARRAARPRGDVGPATRDQSRDQVERGDEWR
ncbi:MAG: hypothetical protein MUF83_07160 [Acidimicrobiales bacterium]|nr:hypothetical protein [Acidimicrobiales bacterium]